MVLDFFAFRSEATSSISSIMALWNLEKLTRPQTWFSFSTTTVGLFDRWNTRPDMYIYLTTRHPLNTMQPERPWGRTVTLARLGGPGQHGLIVKGERHG